MSLATNAALYRAVAKLLTSWGWPVEEVPPGRIMVSTRYPIGFDCIP